MTIEQNLAILRAARMPCWCCREQEKICVPCLASNTLDISDCEPCNGTGEVLVFPSLWRKGGHYRQGANGRWVRYPPSEPTPTDEVKLQNVLRDAMEYTPYRISIFWDHFDEQWDVAMYPKDYQAGPKDRHPASSTNLDQACLDSLAQTVVALGWVTQEVEA